MCFKLNRYMIWFMNSLNCSLFMGLKYFYVCCAIKTHNQMIVEKLLSKILSSLGFNNFFFFRKVMLHYK